MNETVLRVAICALCLFFCAFFITVSQKNILKIFIGIEIMLNSALLLLCTWQNPHHTAAAAIFTAVIPISAFCGLFIIYYLYKKFRTFDTDVIAKTIARERSIKND